MSRVYIICDPSERSLSEVQAPVAYLESRGHIVTWPPDSGEENFYRVAEDRIEASDLVLVVVHEMIGSSTGLNHQLWYADGLRRLRAAMLHPRPTIVALSVRGADATDYIQSIVADCIRSPSEYPRLLPEVGP